MSEHPFYVYITVGDYQWNIDGFPMDSAASIEALFEWMAKTYEVKRVYWRGEQDRIWLQNCVLRRENPYVLQHLGLAALPQRNGEDQ